MARKGRPPAAHCDAIVAGWKLVGEDPFYRGLLGMAHPLATLANPTLETFADTGWAQVRVGGNPLRGWGSGRAAVDPRTAILANAWRPGTPAEWAHVLAQALLHVAFNHVDPVRDDEAWRRACEWEAVRFLKAMPIGRRPPSLPLPLVQPPAGDLAAVAAWFAAEGREAIQAAAGLGIAGAGAPGWVSSPEVGAFSETRRRSVTDRLAAAIREAVAGAIEDAGIHDMGYVEPEALVGMVEIRGRGGTVLQPGIRALERAEDFPADAPILVITDGLCDPLSVGRPHAFLMPEGARLPFPSRAPRFAFERDA